MGALYYSQLIDVLRAAGVQCQVNSINEGWERRSRSSGGFAAPPLGVVWHHTASSSSVNGDLNWMIHNSSDAPIGNMLLARDGVVWPIAAGAANTQGKGGPEHFSRGTVPVDQGNTTMWGLEVANAGTGEQWPEVQIDAYFKASNALNAMFGNLPTDVVTHHEYAPDRKIDPATAYAVRGPWVPGSVTTSGTWSGDDIRFECARRMTPIPIPPTPTPEPEEDEDMAFIMHNTDTGEVALVYGDGLVTGLAGQDLGGYTAKFGEAIDTDPVVWGDFLRKSPR